jgi:transcriptional regulator with XRE-family HTH domain
MQRSGKSFGSGTGGKMDAPAARASVLEPARTDGMAATTEEGAPAAEEVFVSSEEEPPLEDGALDAINDDKVQEYLDQRVIGERIRGLRLKRSMGLIELGTRTGLSASFLSQLETGRVVPTLRNLARIALVFEKDLAWFFREEKPVDFRILRRKDRVRLILDRKDASRFISESLGILVPDRNIVPCLAEFYPKAAACEFTPKIFTGQEFIFLIEGALWITTPREKQHLEAGDVAWIDGTTRRQYECSGANTAQAMIITFPRE